MNASEKPLSKFLKFVFWFVAVNSGLGALSLFLFADQTETHFFWKIAPPINAMLLGGMYLVAGLVVAYVAMRGTWESARVVTIMGLTTGTMLLITTLIHVDRFVPGIKLAYWLFVYFAFPAAIVFLYRSYESSGASWQALKQAIKPATRAAAMTVGAGLLLVAAIAYVQPAIFINLGLWKISDLMVRVLASWILSLAASTLWFGWEKDWTRVQLIAYVLIATPIAVGVVMAVNATDVAGNPVGVAAFGAAIALLAVTGIFMLWNQRQA